MMFSNNYWTVGGNAGQVWSSATAKLVSFSDVDFVAWRDAGGIPTPIATMDELRQVFADNYPPGMLDTYAADLRWKKEVAGFDFNGIAIATDDRSQTKILGIRMAADADPTFTTPWAVGSEIYQLGSEEIVAISNAARDHVQECFATYAALITGIQAMPPTITTRDQIDAAFAD